MKGLEQAICPSVSGDTPDCSIIGFIGHTGHVAPIPTPVPVTPAIRSTLGAQPERQFRFAAPCITAACMQWKGNRCGLIGEMQGNLNNEPARPIVRCGIRANCVWFRDSGLEACQVCPSVTYNPSS